MTVMKEERLVFTNFKLYSRWCKIQNIKAKRLQQEEKIKEKEKENLVTVQTYNIIEKFFIFLLSLVGIIIAIVLFCYLFGWIADNPLYVIIFLLILILLKK